MREITPTYIIAEIFAALMYICIVLTYFSKYKKQILVLNLIGSSFIFASYCLIGGINGALIDFLATVRNIYLLSTYKKEEDSEKSNIVLIFILIFVVILTARFYEGPISLLPAIGIMIFTISIWQKNAIVYKICGIPSTICWLFYNMSIGAKLATYMEGILLSASIIGSFIAIYKYEKDSIKDYFIKKKETSLKN